MPRKVRQLKAIMPPVTPRMHNDLSRAMWEHQQLGEFTSEEFFGSCKPSALVQWREAVAADLRKLGYSTIEIAAMFRKKTHTTILYTLRRAHARGMLPNGWNQKGWKEKPHA